MWGGQWFGAMSFDLTGASANDGMYIGAGSLVNARKSDDLTSRAPTIRRWVLNIRQPLGSFPRQR
jgi:hypothetical protein